MLCILKNGSITAFSIGYITADTKYIWFEKGKKMKVISEYAYDDGSYGKYRKYVKSVKFNSMFIILGFVSGTALGYLLIKKPKIRVKV